MEHRKRYEEIIAEFHALINEWELMKASLPEITVESPKLQPNDTSFCDGLTDELIDNFDWDNLQNSQPDTTTLFAEEHQPAHAFDGYIMPEVQEKSRVDDIQTRPTQSVGKRIWHSPVIGVLVYALMAFVVLGVFIINGIGDDASRDVFGFSAMRVLTRSMQSELPQDSLIITRRVDPDTLQVGDDISFFLDENTIVTHRIVAVHYNHEGSGERAFQTQGIENRMPDHQLVIPENIIGRVIFNNLTIGRIATIIQENLIISGILAVMIIGLFASMRMIFSKKPEKTKSTCDYELYKDPFITGEPSAQRT